MKFLNWLIGNKTDRERRLERVISYRFRDRELLRTALSHRSSAKDAGLESNERLEFLGDAVLDLVVSNFLYHRYADLTEGDLTRMKATLVNEAVLSDLALSFELGSFIYMSPEEEKSGGKIKPSITADAFEALLGAVYIDGGLNPAEKLVKKYVLGDYLSIVEDKKFHNYKGELLEFMQARGKGAPVYRVTSQVGPDHDKIFSVAVYSNHELLGEGQGKSKKEAEQQAARQALQRIETEA